MIKMHFQDACLPNCFIILLFLHLLLPVSHGNGNAHFNVIGPDGPLLAILGKDVELPCYLIPNVSAENMELRGYRDHSSPAVHLHQKGKDVFEEQMEEYWGRTTLVRDHISKDKAAVRIHTVPMFDNGTYHCHFKDGSNYGEAALWMKVAGKGFACLVIFILSEPMGLGLHPEISLRYNKEEGVQAECTSAGWFPEPQVEWRDFQGQIIPSVTNVSVSATSGLFSVVSNVVLSDKMRKGLSCSIANPLLLKKRVAKRYLPEVPLATFFRSFQPPVWRIALPLIITALAAVVAGAICIFGKWQRKQKKKLLEEIRKRVEEEQQEQASTDRGQVINVSPSFDQNTSNPKLVLSEDLKSVSRLVFEQYLPENPERFNQDPCILGQERFTMGKYYWEVEVGNRRAWNIGVCLESLSRKGRIPKSPQHGLWAVEFYKKKFRALTFPRTRLHPSSPVHQVRIVLDCEDGIISFYNGTDGSHIYTFTGVSFSGPLRPFFCLWEHDPRPLTICSVSRETQEVAGPLHPSELPQGVPVSPVSESAELFLQVRDPPRTRPMFLSPQSSPILRKKTFLS